MSVEHTVMEQFQQQVARWPDRPALVGDGGRLTYAELDRATARLAHALVAQGATTDEPVAVLAARGTEQLVALLGVLRSGAPYVCLDAEQPQSRLTAQLADSQARILLTDQPQPGFTGTAIRLGDLPQAPTVRLQPPDPADLACLVYTSGSTGAPKGVAVTHGGLANYSRHMVSLLRCADEPRSFASVTSLATDLGNTAVFPALLSGGCVHLVPSEVVIDPLSFTDYARTHAIDHLKITPSHLAALLSYPDADVLPHQALFLGGEALPWELVDRVRSRSGCRIINHYGPTETTIGSLTYEVGPAEAARRPGATVPIGRPIRATEIRVVDTRLERVPDGAAGELLISGAGLARGYWQAPEQTKEQFVSLDDGTRAYRTGDRVRCLDDGSVEFLGRLDQQLKIRGHRVEPAEIEAALRLHPAVARAAVTPVRDGMGQQVLAAFVVPTTAAPPSVRDLRVHLSGLLPPHMVPSSVEIVSALPFTLSGKLDRRALARRAHG
ncbi:MULTISPECIES: amino acid adenylation domain-containing protein [Streptomyces]|uniref:Amino acid adenylation domain-containing protein n=1 Tax=Streptomyces lonegramiae TaxID=3075524 RepID=A0ABU2X7Q6_9ACTN|nr:amino acid adenylation domain-containing protein [Streptomyces sp. DSM 41529]MDT0541526.1 amino acid adenylation domain-containing protein [Streptomyces sp. DSM 41529]